MCNACNARSARVKTLSWTSVKASAMIALMASVESAARLGLQRRQQCGFWFFKGDFAVMGIGLA